MERTKEMLEARVRETPLGNRLKECQKRIGNMCAELRGPKMSIPVEYYDDDFYICTTLADAQAAVEALQASKGVVLAGDYESLAQRYRQLERQVEALQRERDEAITAHRNIVKQFDELTCFIGRDYDPETETWVSGKPPYLSAGTNEVEACKAAVDALRSVAIVLQAALDAEREKVEIAEGYRKDAVERAQHNANKAQEYHLQLSQLQALVETIKCELFDRYDGAPDSPTRWVGSLIRDIKIAQALPATPTEEAT